MAQMKQQAPADLGRLVTVMRQRPLLGAAAVFTLILVLLAAASGALRAISRAAPGELEVVRAGEPVGSRTDVLHEEGSGDEGGSPADDIEPSPSGGERDSDGRDGGVGADGLDPDRDVLVVDVAGAVACPGVVELPASARVRDAIAAAGGLTEDADVERVNRASVLMDGQQVYIPRFGEEAPAQLSGALPAPAGGDRAPAASALVNINTAGPDELDTLPGVGPSTASAIIEDRDANGPFSAPEDLMRVSGIGEKKFERIKDAICV